VAEGALLLGEEVFVRRVVLIDQKLVREVEADAAEGIAGARRLRNMDRSVGVLRQLKTDAIKSLWILLQSREIFLFDN